MPVNTMATFPSPHNVAFPRSSFRWPERDEIFPTQPTLLRFFQISVSPLKVLRNLVVAFSFNSPSSRIILAHAYKLEPWSPTANMEKLISHHSISPATFPLKSPLTFPRRTNSWNLKSLNLKCHLRIWRSTSKSGNKLSNGNQKFWRIMNIALLREKFLLVNWAVHRQGT